MKVKYLITISQCTFYIDISHLYLLCEITTKNSASGPKLVRKVFGAKCPVTPFVGP